MGELRYYTGDVYKGSWKDGLRHGKVHALHMYMYMYMYTGIGKYQDILISVLCNVAFILRVSVSLKCGVHKLILVHCSSFPSICTCTVCVSVSFYNTNINTT